MPIQQLAMLLEVSLNEGVSMPDLGRGLKMGQGSVSKNVKLMSKFMDGDELKGLGLLYTEQDLHERRRFVVHTTPKGQEFLRRLSSLLDFGESNRKGKEEAA
jgi:DNA-binding MarR family transcriptional regulator